MAPDGVERFRGSTEELAAGGGCCRIPPREVWQTDSRHPARHSAVVSITLRKRRILFSRPGPRGPYSAACRDGTASRRIIVSGWVVMRNRAALSAFRAVDMRAGSVEDFGGFHHGFSQGRMRMDRESHVAGQSSHFDRKHTLSD